LVRKALFALGALIVVVAAPVRSEPLNVAADRWVPFIYEDDGRLAGIGINIHRALADIMGHEVRFDYLPNKRLRYGQDSKAIEVVMLDSPVWNTAEQDRGYSYSRPLFRLKEMAFARADQGLDPRSVEDFEGLNVGAMAGYQYGPFERHFAAGRIPRTDAFSEEALIKLLMLERVDVIFMDEIVFAHQARRIGIEEGEIVPIYEISDVPVSVKVRSDLTDLLARFESAVENLRADGKVERLIDDYVGGKRLTIGTRQ